MDASSGSAPGKRSGSVRINSFSQGFIDPEYSHSEAFEKDLERLRTGCNTFSLASFAKFGSQSPERSGSYSGNASDCQDSKRSIRPRGFSAASLKDGKLGKICLDGSSDFEKLFHLHRFQVERTNCISDQQRLTLQRVSQVERSIDDICRSLTVASP